MPPEPSRPGVHPEPPTDLLNRDLPVVEESGPWFRLHRQTNEPLFFGSTGLNRFDAPGREYGACYLAGDPAGAFVEMYGWPTGVRLVTSSVLRARCLARVETSRAPRLVDLAGPVLARLGADERLCSGEHSVAQRWALALWAHPEKPDGLRYRARHDPSRVVIVVFDRARDALRPVTLGSLAEPGSVSLLAEILATYGIGLLDDTV